MDDIKTNENKINRKKTQSQTNKDTDLALFDETLIQIEKTLVKLGEKIDPRQDLRIIDEMQNETIVNNEEHLIDNVHQNMENLHNFTSLPEKQNQSFFGFYTYLALTIAVIFAIYEILNFSKNLIIIKYPFTEPYIEYFYEVIEILAYVIMNLVSFIKNLF